MTCTPWRGTTAVDFELMFLCFFILTVPDVARSEAHLCVSYKEFCVMALGRSLVEAAAPKKRAPAASAVGRKSGGGGRMKSVSR